MDSSELARQVHSLIASNNDFFREQIHSWWNWYESQPPELRDLPLPIVQHDEASPKSPVPRPFSLAEKSVVLSVFHDQHWPEGDAAFP